MSDPTSSESLRTRLDGNAELWGMLVEGGLVEGQPIIAEYAYTARTEQAAQQVIARLAADGLDAKAELTREGFLRRKVWWIEGEFPIERASLAATNEMVTRLVGHEVEGAEFDGWQTLLPPPDGEDAPA